MDEHLIVIGRQLRVALPLALVSLGAAAVLVVGVLFGPAVAFLLGSMMLLTVLFILIALHIKRRRPRDWMPCEAWIAAGLFAATWIGKALL
jgi:hypothetical protein